LASCRANTHTSLSRYRLAPFPIFDHFFHPLTTTHTPVERERGEEEIESVKRTGAGEEGDDDDDDDGDG